MPTPRPQPTLDPSYDPSDPFSAQLRLLKLLVSEGMALPDRVEHSAGELTFLWDEPKVAVIVDLVSQDVRPG